MYYAIYAVKLEYTVKHAIRKWYIYDICVFAHIEIENKNRIKCRIDKMFIHNRQKVIYKKCGKSSEWHNKGSTITFPLRYSWSSLDWQFIFLLCLCQYCEAITTLHYNQTAEVQSNIKITTTTTKTTLKWTVSRSAASNKMSCEMTQTHIHQEA